MPLRTRKNKKPIDYTKCLRSAKSMVRKILYHMIKAPFYKKTSKKLLTVVSIKIGTTEDSLPLSEIVCIMHSVDIIIKNISKALGYDDNDIEISLLEAKPGCFLLEIGIYILRSAVQKYATGVLEGFLKVDFEKEGKRQGDCIRDIFETFMSAPVFKNANAPEAQKIKNARNNIFGTLYANKKVNSINFTGKPEDEIPRSSFIDYIV